MEKNILEELKCTACRKYMYREIPMCNKGHSICKDCKEKIQVCPLCKGKYIVGQRNFSLEKIAEKILKPCIYGCNAGLEIKYHKSDCKLIFRCPLDLYGDCEWKGFYTDLLKHVLSHDKSELEKVYLRYEYMVEMYEKLYFAYDEVFRVTQYIAHEAFQYSIIHEYFGPIEKAKDYIMVIHFKDPEKNSNFTYTQPCTSVKEYINDETPFQISNDYNLFENKSKCNLDIKFIKKELGSQNVVKKVPPKIKFTRGN